MKAELFEADLFECVPASTIETETHTYYVKVVSAGDICIGTDFKLKKNGKVVGSCRLDTPFEKGDVIAADGRLFDSKGNEKLHECRRSGMKVPFISLSEVIEPQKVNVSVYSFTVTEREIDSLFKEYTLHGLVFGQVAPWKMIFTDLSKFPCNISVRARNYEKAEELIFDEACKIIDEKLFADPSTAAGRITRMKCVKHIENLFDLEKMKKDYFFSRHREAIARALSGILTEEEEQALVQKWTGETLRKRKQVSASVALNQIGLEF